MNIIISPEQIAMRPRNRYATTFALLRTHARNVRMRDAREAAISASSINKRLLEIREELTMLENAPAQRTAEFLFFAMEKTSWLSAEIVLINSFQLLTDEALIQ